MNELITVQQLPIIIERLESFKVEVLERVKFAETCVCDAETVKETKNIGQNLTNSLRNWTSNARRLRRR